MTLRTRRERRGGTATAAAWAGPCSHHSRDAEGTGDRNRTADARALSGRPQPRAAPSIVPGPASTGACVTHLLNQAAAQTSRGGLLRAPGSFGEAAPGGPGLVRKSEQKEEDAAEARPSSARSLQRLKFLLSRCLLSARQLVGFPLLSLLLRVSSLSSLAREPLKGTRDPCQALTGAAQTSSAC